MGDAVYLVPLVFLGGILSGLGLAYLDWALAFMGVLIAWPSGCLLAKETTS